MQTMAALFLILPPRMYSVMPEISAIELHSEVDPNAY